MTAKCMCYLEEYFWREESNKDCLLHQKKIHVDFEHDKKLEEAPSYQVKATKICIMKHSQLKSMKCSLEV